VDVSKRPPLIEEAALLCDCWTSGRNLCENTFQGVDITVAKGGIRSLEREAILGRFIDAWNAMMAPGFTGRKQDQWKRKQISNQRVKDRVILNQPKNEIWLMEP
jgi:hypothetical protein